jgi:hypothetical protein
MIRKVKSGFHDHLTGVLFPLFRIAARRVGKGFLPGAAAECLRSSTDHAKKSSTHTVTVTKSGFPGDDVDRVSTLFYHKSGGLNAKLLNRFGRRLTRLRAKCAAELAWTKMRGVGELLDRQWGMEVILGINQGALDAVSFRVKP